MLEGLRAAVVDEGADLAVDVMRNALAIIDTPLERERLAGAVS